jgi:hypothetical protein
MRMYLPLKRIKAIAQIEIEKKAISKSYTET